jgi:hypothetical protein
MAINSRLMFGWSDNEYPTTSYTGEPLDLACFPPSFKTESTYFPGLCPYGEVPVVRDYGNGRPLM